MYDQHLIEVCGLCNGRGVSFLLRESYAKKLSRALIFKVAEERNEH